MVTNAAGILGGVTVDDGDVWVLGNVNCEEVEGAGVWAYGSSRVTVDGIITSAGDYIALNDEPRAYGDYVTPSTKSGYLEYNDLINDGANRVWVKAVSGGGSGGGTQFGGATIKDPSNPAPNPPSNDSNNNNNNNNNNSNNNNNNNNNNNVDDNDDTQPAANSNTWLWLLLLLALLVVVVLLYLNRTKIQAYLK